MITVSRPRFSARTTFETCIRTVQDYDLRARLFKVLDNIQQAADEYAQRASAGELHLVPKHLDVGGHVSSAEMSWVYEQKLRGKGGEGREIYEAIKLLPKHDICPFCGHGIVWTLDHILPKSRYAPVAVAPDNLVACCRDCNAAKLDTVPSTAADATVHPYFDDLSGEQWLDADVIKGVTAAVSFRVNYVANWSPDFNARVRKYFNDLNLNYTYMNQAARELSGQTGVLAEKYQNYGKHGVEKELFERQKSWEKYDKNSWQAAMYRALIASDWYCDGGFQVGL